jgi:hypothetical protein
MLEQTPPGAGGNMTADPSTVNPRPTPSESCVTTLFLKPTFVITVQRNTLAVSVQAHPEVVTRPRPPPARG